MTEDGYTLAETLAALMVLGLAIGGVGACAHLLGRWQASISEVAENVQAVRAAQVALERLLNDNTPFRAHMPDDFTGDAKAFRFRCGAAECSVRISAGEGGEAVEIAEDGKRIQVMPLSPLEPAQFFYRSRQGNLDRWPPQGPERQELQAVSLIQDADGQSTPVLEIRTWREQPASCHFDPVMQDCR